MKIRLILFASELHDKASIMNTRRPLFEALDKIGDVETISSNDVQVALSDAEDLHTICFIASGGTEEKFAKAAQYLPTPITILSDGYHNSFAAAFEIVTWLSQRDIAQRHINLPLDSPYDEAIAQAIAPFDLKKRTQANPNLADAELLYQKKEVRELLSKSVIGLIGGESSWLIASEIDKSYLSEKHGVKFVDVNIRDVAKQYVADPGKLKGAKSKNAGIPTPEDLHNAVIMTRVLERICDKYSLTAFTIKCFDLLKSCKMTSCAALSVINDLNITAGCEGDIPTLWTMIVARAITQKSSFMANPSSSSEKDLTVDFAHCAVPITMVDSYTLPTHFESGIGVGVAGILPIGRYSLFKIGGPRLDKFFMASGEIICNTNIAQRCRTQVRFRFDSREDFDSFIENRLGNHIVLCQGTII